MLSHPCTITRRFKFLVFDTLSLHCTILLYHNTQQTKTHSETLFKRWEKEELRNYTVGRTKVATFFPVSMRVSSPLFVSMKIEDGWPILKVVFSSGHDMVRNKIPFVWYPQSHFIKRVKWWIFCLMYDLIRLWKVIL